MIKHHHLMLSTVGVAMLATAAMAQTSAPTPPSSAPVAPTATQSTASSAAEPNLAGQGKWRTSKRIGVDVYGPDDKKVGDVTEVIVDKTGKVEMVPIGVGGFLGIGSKDVAVPFDQVTWSDQPIAPPAPAPAAAPSGSAGSAGGGMASPPAAAAAPRAPAMYPDHGKITMTKDQLKSAPSVTYSGN